MIELTEVTWVKSYPTNNEIFGLNLVTVLNPAVWVVSFDMIAVLLHLLELVDEQRSFESNLRYNL